MFCDELKLKLIAGKGGDGSMSFRRQKFIPRGGPDGGDGGRGGDIIFKINPNLNTLSHLAKLKTYRAEDGTAGGKKNMHGKNGEDLILEVPQGTIVFTIEKDQQLADLSDQNFEFKVAKGGKGGLGNTHFASSTHQTPRFAEKGEPGEEKEILLELKLVADVGLIGLPSAGKSTLISVISNARPKIAAYQFTTLTPNLGVVDMPRFGGELNDNFIVADIPGLIEGASKGKGLGHQFLRHISRTKLLVHIIDGYLDDISQNYKTINTELKAHDPKLSKVKQIIVINKIDLLSKETLEKRVKELEKSTKNAEIFLISALTKQGLKQLIFEIVKKLKELKKTIPKIEKEKPVVLKPHENKVQFEIEKIIRKKDHKIFRIKGKKIEQLLVMTDINNPEGLERIYRYMETSGLKKLVGKNGAKIGDIIRIKEKNIPYRK